MAGRLVAPAEHGHAVLGKAQLVPNISVYNDPAETNGGSSAAHQIAHVRTIFCGLTGNHQAVAGLAVVNAYVNRQVVSVLGIHRRCGRYNFHAVTNGLDGSIHGIIHGVQLQLCQTVADVRRAELFSSHQELLRNQFRQRTIIVFHK